MINSLCKILPYLVISFLVASCSAPPRAPIQERSVLNNRQEVEPMGGELIRIVQKGDTLYSIAFSSGLDVNKLAGWNDLSDTARINVGEKIRLTQPIGYKSRPLPQPVKEIVKSSAKKATQESARVTAAIPRQVSVTKPTLTDTHNKKSLSSSLEWRWPTKGRVVTRFSPSNGKQGIDIQGVSRQSIITSAAGEVVYVGNSLKGYGNLIIVKHSEHFLSAYAHNDEILVIEGEKVTRNKLIAMMGVDKTRRNILHFQIRKDGKPIDPLKFLAKKN